MPAASPTRVRGRRATRPSGDDREAAILRTLEDMLEQRPFAEISVDDLAKGAGLSRLVRETCDTVAAIPMGGSMESLNAGVAAGIALYEISRRR